MAIQNLLIRLTLFGSFTFLVTSLNAEETTAAAKTYPLTTCVVSGEKLDVMAPPAIIQHNGQEVRFCCKDCIKDFNKDPEKYLKHLNEAKSNGAASQ